MGGVGLRDDYREIATEIIAEGKTLLAREATRAAEVEAWQKPALNVLHELGSERYEAREERHAGFLEWAGNTLSERARKHSIRLTLDALEDAALHQESIRQETSPPDLQARPALHADGDAFDEARWTQIAEEAERMRLVEEAARKLEVALPRTIRWEDEATYNSYTDTLTLPLDAGRYSGEEYKALAGHELQHKAQIERRPGLSIPYRRARDSLSLLVRELVQPDDALPEHLRATTMLAGISAYATFVLLGKSVGYQRELDADAAGARVASPEAMIGALKIGEEHARRAELPSQERPRGKTWLERVVGTRVARLDHALDDEHPSLKERIDSLRRQEHDGEAAQRPR